MTPEAFRKKLEALIDDALTSGLCPFKLGAIIVKEAKIWAIMYRLNAPKPSIMDTPDG